MKDDRRISLNAAIDAIDGVDWFHQNQHGEMVHGANSDEHQAWYKAEDIYKAIEGVPSAQPSVSKTEIVEDTISRQAAKDYIDSQKGRPFIGCTIGEAMKIMLDEVPPAHTAPSERKCPEN